MGKYAVQLKAYGDALAARELGCEWSIIAESGIEVSRPEKPFFEAENFVYILKEVYKIHIMKI